jgi:hypothetical protein
MKPLLVIIVLVASLSMFVGCKGDKGDMGPIGPAGPVLAINTLSAEPPIVDPGDTTRLVSSVVFNGNGTLSYLWTAASGTVLSPTTAAAWWVAPTSAVSYGLITLAVTGEGNTVQGFLSIPINGAIPTQDLVAYYPFNGNSNDESGNNRNLTNSGATLTADRFGNASSAYSFDGATSYLQANGYPALLTTFTYSAWIKLNESGDHGGRNFGCYGREGTSVSTWDVATSVEARWISVFDVTNNVMSTTQVVGSQWTHVVIVYNSTTRIIYIDSDASTSGPISTPIYSPLPNNFRIGRHISNGTQPFLGMIDDVRIYSRALSLSEIQQLYHEGGW